MRHSSSSEKAPQRFPKTLRRPSQNWQLPSLEGILTSRGLQKTHSIRTDSFQTPCPVSVWTKAPEKKRYACVKTCAARFTNSFHTKAVTTVNSEVKPPELKHITALMHAHLLFHSIIWTSIFYCLQVGTNANTYFCCVNCEYECMKWNYSNFYYLLSEYLSLVLECTWTGS